MDSSRSSVKNNRNTHADSTKETVEAGEVPCGAHTTQQPPIATPTAATGGANRLTATLITMLQPGFSDNWEFAALTTFQNKTTSRDTLISPSR